LAFKEFQFVVFFFLKHMFLKTIIYIEYHFMNLTTDGTIAAATSTTTASTWLVEILAFYKIHQM
jgi:hypothetical protein